jgi:hypothetical protein
MSDEDFRRPWWHEKWTDIVLWATWNNKRCVRALWLRGHDWRLNPQYEGAGRLCIRCGLTQVRLG